MTHVDNFPVTSELISLLKRWNDSDFAESYLEMFSDTQDFLTRLLCEADEKEKNQITLHLQYIVGIKDELKDLLKVISIKDNKLDHHA